MPSDKFEQITIIYSDDWDELIKETYGKPYCYQQQDCFREKGLRLIDPTDIWDTDGVPLREWLARDPAGIPQDLEKAYAPSAVSTWAVTTWWEREFYPLLQELVGDLDARGLLPEGKFYINVDW